MSKLREVALPDFGVEETFPTLSVACYEDRLAAATTRLAEAGLDFLVVYGDREHAANLAFLTGFDPRFEEALLVLDRAGDRLLLVGNECMGYLPDPALRCRIALFQEFSLPGQPRGQSRPVRELLTDFGIGAGHTVGCAGWKSYTPGLVDDPTTALDLPAYLVDLLREMTGAHRRVQNAIGILIDLEDGLRITNSAAQIAQFEYAACRTAEGVRQVLARVHPGVRERELEHWLDSAGLPLSCHRMLNFGAKAQRGLSSAGDGQAHLGDAVQVAFGVTGALTCRAGVIAHGPDDLPTELRDFYPRFIANYFDVLATWYRTVAIGVTGGAVFDAVETQRDPHLFTFAVNPGHFLQLEEWVHSPFSAGNGTRLRSGTALQMDIIPVSTGPFCSANAEDGIVLADQALQAELAAGFPRCWARLQARRQFMIETLGISLDASVLPLGNTSGWFAPYILSPHLAMTCDRYQT